MKSRIGLTAIILILFLTQITLNIQAQTQYILTVDKKGEGDFTTITEAINHSSKGTTIYIKPGEYKEIINIKKEITLIGENKEETIINPTSEKNMYAIRISTPKVTIKNLKITNQAPGLYTTGIRISASETTIENCDLYNTPIGILTWTSENIINKCKFWGCQDEGIALIGSKYSECNSNIITNCIFYKNCDGLELQYSSKNRITGCEFYDNTHTGIDAIASSNNENTISNCKIYNNMVHGIYLSSSSKNQITNCYISDNTDGNILMDGDSIDNQISLNPVLENNIDNTETEEEHATSKESLLTRVYGLISRLKINQLIPLFTSNNF